MRKEEQEASHGHIYLKNTYITVLYIGLRCLFQEVDNRHGPIIENNVFRAAYSLDKIG